MTPCHSLSNAQEDKTEHFWTVAAKHTLAEITEDGEGDGGLRGGEGCREGMQSADTGEGVRRLGPTDDGGSWMALERKVEE